MEGTFEDTDGSPRSTSDLLEKLHEQIQQISTETITFSMAGVAPNELPVVSDSGHDITWFDYDNFTSSTSGPNDRGGFWCDPGKASYASMGLQNPVSWGDIYFSFLEGQGTQGGTACIAITEVPVNGVTPMKMPVHFWTTRWAWAMTLWVPGVGQHTLKTKPYAVPLTGGDFNTTFDKVYNMRFAIRGDSILFRPADGITRRVQDPRIEQYASVNLFAESYMPNTTDDIPIVYGMSGGSGKVPQLLIPA